MNWSQTKYTQTTNIQNRARRFRMRAKSHAAQAISNGNPINTPARKHRKMNIMRVAIVFGGMMLLYNAASALSLLSLDTNTVTTGGTAVTALNAGHRTAGGWIYNPTTATQNLCINEIGTATTTSQGDTTCIAPGASYSLAPSYLAVSVNSTDGTHAFSGRGFQN